VVKREISLARGRSHCLLKCIELFARLYVKEILSRGRLPSTKSKAADFTNVNITFKSNTTTVGGAARDHMMAAVRLGFCDLEAQVFKLCSIEWLELMDV
jgi:hypothetical protein